MKRREDAAASSLAAAAVLFQKPVTAPHAFAGECPCYSEDEAVVICSRVLLNCGWDVPDSSFSKGFCQPLEGEDAFAVRFDDRAPEPPKGVRLLV